MKSVCCRISWILPIFCLLLLPAGANAVELDDGRGDVADVFFGSTAIQLDPIIEAEFWVLTLTGPCGPIQKEFGPKDEIVFDLRDLEDDPNGQWTWELRRMPSVDPSVRKALQESRGTGEEQAVLRNLRDKGLLPTGPLGQAGAFTVREGIILDPKSGEEDQEKGGASSLPLTSAGVGTPGSGTATGGGPAVEKAQIISPDGVVYNSLCVGFDCPTNPTFGSDTIRLQENNLRIHFDDTSGGTFPNQDWRIEANSNANGGGEYFRIIDSTAVRNIFTLEANAPSNSLVVDSGGRVGFGTANPVLELHVANGDSPGLRLEQTTASGFGAQTWDVVGNETSFFVRDASSGSTLPFRIFPSSPSNTLVVRGENVGIGTTSPDHELHIAATGEAATDVQFKIQANTDPAFDFTEDDSGVTWRFINNNAVLKVVDIGAGADGAEEFRLTQAGDLTITGEIFTSGSCSGGCDYAFDPGNAPESIEEHAEYMWTNRHLPSVGPTPEDGPFNLSQMTGGMLNELEKAHIYIEELHQRLAKLEATLAEHAEDE